jgi:peptide deformylase
MHVLTHPNAALRQTALEVDPTAERDLPRLAATMAKLMYDALGLAIAATQIGVLKRVVVYDLSSEGDDPVVLCNPVIVERSTETSVDDEGCLSLPGIGVPVERNVRVTCEALDLRGEAVRIDADGLFARMLQHEIDHLDGMLIIDRANPEERRAALIRYREAREAESTSRSSTH